MILLAKDRISNNRFCSATGKQATTIQPTGEIMINLMQGDCLERMKEISNASVDLILTDPPYGTIKDLFKNASWDTVIDIDKMYKEADRILRKNGRLVLFCQEPFTSDLLNKSIPNLKFNQRIIWEKNTSGNMLFAKKACVNFFEDILIFNKVYEYEALHPLREYFKRVLDFIGLNRKQINEKMGDRSSEHTFYINSTQFGLCTESTYNKLINVFEINKMEGFKVFSDLVEINKAFNNKYKIVFNLKNGEKYKSSILKYKKDSGGYHPTQKPVLLLEDLIATYSNENDTVLDFAMGSGSTGVACKNTKRKFIGIELDEEYFNIASERINNTK